MPSPDQSPVPDDQGALAPWRQPWVTGTITGLAIAATAVISIGVFYLSIRDALLDDLRDHLRKSAEVAAALIPGERLAGFTDSSQTGSPEYLTLSRPLAALLETNPDIRFAYVGLVRRDSMFFILDGDRTAERAFVMQPDAATPGEQIVARTGQTFVERQPSPTVWGNGIRAYVPIQGAGGAYVGVTLDARRYQTSAGVMARSAALGIGVALVLAILVGFRSAGIERSQRRAAGEVLEARRLAAVAAEERLVLEHQLHRKQKMEALGTLAGGVAHDFNNLLAVMLGQADMVAEDAPPNSSVGASAAAIRTAATRARDLVRRILLFARPEAENRSVVAVGPVVDEAVEMLRATLPSSNRIVWQRPPEPVSVLADGSELMQVLMNLGVNASQAFRDQRGNITFTLARASLGTDEAVRIGLEAGHYARISVQDDGIGMSEELRRRIFEPFFTTKGVGEGSGLGLSVAEGVIRGYQGVIEVDSKVGVGTTFSIFLPAADDAPPVQAEALPAPAETARGGGRRVLLLDDNDLVLATVRRILTRAGYSVTTHADPATALNELESNPCAFDLLITDRTMPGLSGPEVAQRARALNPDLPVVLLTGANQSADDEAPWFSAVVMKPVERAALLRTVDQLLVSKS